MVSGVGDDGKEHLWTALELTLGVDDNVQVVVTWHCCPVPQGPSLDGHVDRHTTSPDTLLPFLHGNCTHTDHNSTALSHSLAWRVDAISSMAALASGMVSAVAMTDFLRCNSAPVAFICV